MPITEWICRRCGARFELLTFPGTPEEPVCEKCGSKDVDKQLSRFSAAGNADSGASSSGGGCGPGRFT